MKRYTDKGAVISGCGLYRYRLWRRWDDSLPVLPFIMLNPSTADGEEDDHTIRKCVGFAERMNCGGIEIVNLFAFRATKPLDLKLAGWSVGPSNDAHICTVLRAYGPRVLCAWGVNIQCAAGWARVAAVRQLLEEHGGHPVALRLTGNGVPWHPLTLPYSDEVVELPA